MEGILLFWNIKNINYLESSSLKTANLIITWWKKELGVFSLLYAFSSQYITRHGKMNSLEVWHLSVSSRKMKETFTSVFQILLILWVWKQTQRQGFARARLASLLCKSHSWGKYSPISHATIVAGSRIDSRHAVKEQCLFVQK